MLKDGASSIYGSDAIAGVINVITRQNFEGAMASVYYGQYGQGDGAIKKGDVVWGMGNDRGSIVVSGEYRKEDGVGATARGFAQYPRGPLHPPTTGPRWVPTVVLTLAASGTSSTPRSSDRNTSTPQHQGRPSGRLFLLLPTAVGLGLPHITAKT